MPAPASERRRTGTPQVGVPVVDEQAPVTGVIEAKADRSGPTQEPGISQAWYEDDDGSRKHTSPSTTDMSLYDEPPMRKRWPIVVGVLAVLLVGAAATFAFTHGGSEKKPAPPPAVAQAPVAMPPVAVPPSTIIDPGPGSAAAGSGSAAAVAKVAPATHDTSPPAHKETPPAHVATQAKQTSPTDHSHKGPFDDISADDLAKRRPGGANTTTTNPTTTTTDVTQPKDTSKPGVSGAEGPQDPYGGGVADPGDGAAPDKKAEFYANLGQQQLGGGDLAGAAASFKKATELDPKNTNAVIGMGEIALRQGLFGDAIAHLRKAGKLAPRSSQVFTLLGEAYLGTGQNSTAADNFKKALQLDPDNTRARDGYNEASSRVPPPSDDN
jgi:TolA-binding protein